MRLAGSVSVSVAFVLVALKAWAWYATGSVALLSSLADSILDFLASLIIFFAVRFALEPADREHRFGHGKLEAIAGLAQAMVITGSAIYVGVQAVSRLLAPQPIAAPAIGTGVMIVSLLMTITLVAFQRHIVSQTGSIAIGADAAHYQADVLTNIAVLAAIGFSTFFDWHLADPLLGLLVVVLILVSVRAIVIKSFDILLDHELTPAARREISTIASAHEAVKGVHDLRTRSSGIAQFIQFHLELSPELTLAEAHEITDQVENAVRQRFPKAEVIIHADPFGIAERRDDF